MKEPRGAITKIFVISLPITYFMFIKKLSCVATKSICVRICLIKTITNAEDIERYLNDLLQQLECLLIDQDEVMIMIIVIKKQNICHCQEYRK